MNVITVKERIRETEKIISILKEYESHSIIDAKIEFQESTLDINKKLLKFITGE